ncbi:MAG: cyclic nucleotide-binding domain-containing protein [Desulfobacterales bacterium]|jgi:CRP-like cAMP-binding protein
MLSIDAVRDIIILNYLSDEMLNAVIPHLDILQFEEEDTIFQEGDPAERMFFLKRGKILLEKRISDKISFAIGAVKPGFSFGWSAVLGEGMSYSSMTVCAEPCQVYSIRGKKIRNLLDNDHDMAFLFHRRLIWVIKNRLDHRTSQFVTALRNHPDIESLI